MRVFMCALALSLGLGFGIGALAQQRKKDGEKSIQQTTPTFGGYQKCEGSLFLLQDGGTGPRCQRSDGKVCQVRGGTSGQAILTDCK